MKKISGFAAFLAVALLLANNFVGAQAPLNVKWEVIREPASKTNYANLVILLDAFMAGDQLEKEASLYAKSILDTLDIQARDGKWSEDWSKVRIILAKTASEDSGASNPSKGVNRNTFFSSFLREGDGAILLSDNGYQKVAQVLSSVPGGYDVQKDMAILVVNDKNEKTHGTFLTFGEGYGVATTHVYERPDKSYGYKYVASHEFGHNWLADEYPESAGLYEVYFREDWFNIMRVPPQKLSSLKREDITWSSILTAEVKIPTDRTMETSNKIVGFYKLRQNEPNESYYIGFTTGIMNGGWNWRPRFNPVCQEGIRRGLRQRFEMLAADFNEDGMVDLDDFFLFADGFGKHKGEAGFNSRFDLDKSGEISFDDFFLFADSFGKKKGARKPVPAATKPVIGKPIIICNGQHGGPESGDPHEHHEGSLNDSEFGIQHSAFRLDQNFPNPFNPETTIQYRLPEGTEVRLTIYNILGQELLTFVEGRQEAGNYKIVWNGRDRSGRKLASGVYYYKLTAEKFETVRSLTILK